MTGVKHGEDDGSEEGRLNLTGVKHGEDDGREGES